MAKLKDILGINARAAEYLRLNKKGPRWRCKDKLRTKRLLKKFKIPHPQLLAQMKTMEQVRNFDLMSLPKSFVIKTVQGLEGAGVLIIKRRAKYAGEWWTIDGRKVTEADLRLHLEDILEGRFSRHNVPDTAMIEERVKLHPKFRKLAVKGVPDVRVLVFNGVPIMGMLRLPTEESGGRANLHQGAIGLGVDVATGITTFGVYKGKRIKYFPNSTKKINGITVPFWKEVLKIATQTQKISKLGYMAVDVLIDEERGPLVLEFNDKPGLEIQLANMAGLRRRLMRVEGLEVGSSARGINISKALFASKFANRVKYLPGKKRLVGIFENVKLKVGKKERVEIKAKIDTGAMSTSIDREIAKKYGLLKRENILWEKNFKSSLGTQRRLVIGLTFWIKGKRIQTRAGVTDRHNLRRKLLIGRRDLREFLVDANLVRLRK